MNRIARKRSTEIALPENDWQKSDCQKMNDRNFIDRNRIARKWLSEISLTEIGLPENYWQKSHCKKIIDANLIDRNRIARNYSFTALPKRHQLPWDWKNVPWLIAAPENCHDKKNIFLSMSDRTPWKPTVCCRGQLKLYPCTIVTKINDTTCHFEATLDFSRSKFSCP